MSSDQVNASPREILELAKKLERYQQDMQSAAQEVTRALSGVRWRDGQYERFTNRLQEMQKHNRKFIETDLRQMTGALRQLAERLEAARTTRF